MIDARLVAGLAALVAACGGKNSAGPDGSIGDGGTTITDGNTGSDAKIPATFVQEILITAGVFERGCDPALSGADAGVEDPEVCQDDEGPAADVTVGAFYMDEHEVTQAAYQECIDAERCRPPEAGSSFDPINTPRKPVTNVTWCDAWTYCDWMGKSLPTEAEWEKAARGTDGRTYPWGDTAPDCSKAHGAGCSPSGTTVVASHPAGKSPYGLHDLAGNVLEWVNDWYASDAYQGGATSDPTGPGSSCFASYSGGSTCAPTGNCTGVSSKVFRGGGYQDPRSTMVGNQLILGSLRTTDRFIDSPGEAYGDLGFRCVKRVTP